MDAATPDFIPDQPTQAATPDFIPDQPAQSAAPDFIPDAAAKDYGSLGQQGLTALEQGASGLTGGLSKVFETKALGVNPEDIKGREEANPLTSFGSNLAGTVGLLAGTGGLGLEAEAGAGLAKVIGSNAAQGAILGASNSVSNDLALGDPNANASKIASDAGISALWGGGIGGVASALISGLPAGLKSLSGAANKLGAPDLTVNPDSLSWLDKIRMGIFAGSHDPAATAQTFSKGINDLHSLTSLENMEGLATDASGNKAIEEFEAAKKPFLKAFGNEDGSVDAQALTDHITDPSSKTSKANTITLNNYFNAIKKLGGVTLKDADMNEAMQTAQAGLKDWTDQLSYASQVGQHYDLEYGAMGEGRPYSSRMDLPAGEEAAEGALPGVKVGAGDTAGRVSSFGSEQASPFEPSNDTDLKYINSKISDFQKKVADIANSQAEKVPIAADISSAAEEAGKSTNAIQNISNATEAIKKGAPTPLLHGAEAPAALFLGPKFYSAVKALEYVRKYSGDGGLYRLGGDIASPIKVLDGVARATKKVDDKIGDGARRIFTGTSAQARKLENE